MREAKAAGQPAPARAVVAMLLGVLSVLVTAGVLTAYRLDKRAGEAQASAALKRAEKAREAETLDPKAACTLAEAWLLAHRGVGAAEVKCEGPLRQGAVAQLDGVSLPALPRDAHLQHLPDTPGAVVRFRRRHARDCPAAPPAVKDPGQGVDKYEDAVAEAASR